MAQTKSSKYPYRWANGSYHSRPETKAAPKDSTGYAGKVTYAPGGPSNPVTITSNMPQSEKDRLAGMVTSYVTPTQPLDPDQVNAQVTATRNVGLADLYGTWQQGNLDQNYGFGPGGAANPYSQAALLQENYQRSQLGTTNNYASQGQLNSGAYGRMQNENTHQYDIGYDKLRRQYDQQSGQIGFDRLQTYANQGSNVDEATYQALLKALRGGG